MTTITTTTTTKQLLPINQTFYFRWNYKRRCITYNNVPIAGLLPILQNLFYSNYSYYDAIKQERNLLNKPTSSSIEILNVHDVNNLVKHSIDSGKNVDRLIGITIKLYQKYNLPKDIFINKTYYDNACKENLISDEAKRKTKFYWNRKRNNVISLIIKFWWFLKKFNLKPIYHELPVGNPNLRIATRIDVVCQNENNQKWVLIEIKTGFDRYYNCSNGYMDIPLQNFKNSIKNQHQLQLLMNQTLFEYTYPTCSIDTSFILQFHDQGITTHPLEIIFLNYKQQIINRIDTR